MTNDQRDRENNLTRGGPSEDFKIGEDAAGGKPAMIACPSCGVENIQGTDYCVNCNSDLRTLDIPADTSSPAVGPPGEDVGVLARREAVQVAPTMSVRDVIHKLRDANAGCAVVVDRGRVAGVFTERDVLNQVTLDPDSSLSRPVSDLMTHDPVLLRNTDSVLVAMNKMGIGGFRHIPLVDEHGSLRGMLTGRDLLEYVSAQLA